MKKLFIFTSAAVSLLLAGCAKNPDQEAEQRHGRVVTLSATIDVDENTKASVGSDGSFKWASGDQIGVWTSNGVDPKFTRFDLKGGEEGKTTAEFTGTLEDGYYVVPGPVVFPYRAAHGYDPSTQTLTYNQVAMTMESEVTKSHMAGMYSGAGTVSLKHLSGLIRFVVFNVPASTGKGGYIRLRTMDKQITGNFTVDMSAPTPQIVAPYASGEQNFNLNFSSSAPEDVVGKMYIASFPVPVGTYSYLRLSVQKEGGAMIGYKEKDSPTTITRAQMINMPEVTLNAVDLADNESGLRDNFNKVDYTTDYTGSITTDATIEVVSNPKKTVMNASNNVLKVTSTASGGYSGLIDILTKGAFTSAPVAYYPSGYRDGTKAFTVKMLYADPADASKYYPWGQCKSTQASMVRPDRVNGSPYDGTAEKWAELIKPGDWNVLQWTCDNSGTYRIDIKPFLNNSGGNQTSDAARIIYFDDFRFLK